MPVRPGGQSYNLTARLGFEIKLKNRKKAAVRVFPVSYVPTRMACPALDDDGLCAIHETKPQRCRTMPLSGARAQSDQLDLLLPKANWACDVSDAAPLLYRDKIIMDRTDFDAERLMLEEDSKILKPFADLMLAAVPSLRRDLAKIAARPKGGHLILNFSTLLPRLAHVDVYAFAAQQRPVMQAFADKTAGQPDLKDEHQRYVGCAAEWQRLLDNAD